jgi:DNA-binding MarR family transcriptional regulator
MTTTASLETTPLDGIDDTILTTLARTGHVYRPLQAIHERSGLPIDDLRRRLRRLEQAGHVHRLRTEEASLQDHYCLTPAGQTYAAALPG